MRNLIDRVLEYLLVIIMSVLVLDVLWQILSRYIMLNPSSYTDELAGFLLVWLGLMGAAYVAGKKEHLAIDILLTKLEGKKKRVLEIIISIIVLLFSVIVLVLGGANLVYTRFLLEVTSSALQLNMGYVYLSLPLSGILITYFTIDNMLIANQIKEEEL